MQNEGEKKYLQGKFSWNALLGAGLLLTFEPQIARR